MNIAFFLIPKEDVVYLEQHVTMRQAMEKMDYHRYTAIPIIDNKGRYVATLTEGDLLRKMKSNPHIKFEDTDKISLQDVSIRRKHKPVPINANMEDLVSLAIEQNFIPIVDDNKVFIGIIRRREIIDYYYSKYFSMQE
jgi:CBS domain-containing protein